MGTIQGHIALEADFKHESMPEYGTLSPAEERSLRQAFQDLLFGDKQVEVLAAFATPVWSPTFDDPEDTGHAGTTAVRAALEAALADYNSVDTGLWLSIEDTDYHCVRYVWRDGERVVEYNYALTETIEGSSAAATKAEPLGPLSMDDLTGLGIGVPLRTCFLAVLRTPFPVGRPPAP